ncbi:MAG: type II secretion system GspH family protein [Lachnospiraceae bacterium]|nr:type II secretion system GspH family protein [Lachnospiraceae bacterium]
MKNCVLHRITRKMLNNNQGLTLVELMVGIMIFAVITTSAMSIFAPMLRTMLRATEIAEYNTLFDNIANIIVSDLASSTAGPVLSGADVRLNPGGTLEDFTWTNGQDLLWLTINFPQAVVYTADGDGVLLRNGNPLLPQMFLNQGTAATFVCVEVLTLDAANNVTERFYRLTLTLSNIIGDGGITRDYIVRPLVLNQY